MKYSRATAAACFTALSLAGAATSFAGEAAAPGKTPLPPPPAPAEVDPVSGTLNLTLDTHFVSYGQDVWAAGTDWNDALFHPSFELAFDLGGGWKATLGTWWDVNDNASSNIGDAIQEIDVWAGIGYTTGKWSFGVAYQEWMYASQSERIVDFKVAYADGLINPSVMFHGRVDGAEPFDTGVATVLGVAPTAAAGPVTFSFPLQVAFDTDGFHGGDAGFSFASAGVGASVPLEFLPGKWALNAGVTYYHTNDDVIVTNPDSDFVTGSIGLGLTF